MPEQPAPLVGAFQTLYDLIERYGGERTEQQHEMWWQVENAMEELADAGIAEGRQQATAGLKREWGVDLRNGSRPWAMFNETAARDHAACRVDNRIVSRLVGPWEPAAEQHEHCDHWQQGDGDCCDCKKPNWCPEGGVTPENEQALRAAWEADPGARGPWEPAEQPEPAGHQSFTELRCVNVEGPHPRHTWSHKDEPCEGHVCPGEKFQVRHDPGELMEEPDLYPPAPKWRRDDACGREHTYRGECVYAEQPEDGTRESECQDCLCCTRSACANRRCGACPCTEG